MDIHCGLCGTKLEKSEIKIALFGYRVNDPKTYVCPGCKKQWAIDGQSGHLIMEEISEPCAIGCC